MWSTDLAETWQRSWVIFQKPPWLTSLTFSFVVMGGGGGVSHFSPFEHRKSSLPGGILKVPQDPTGKLCSQTSLTMNSTIIELSVHACNFVVEVLHREEPGARFWPKLMSTLHPKKDIFQNFIIFTSLLALLPYL